MVEVRDAGNKFLCYATWNATAYICARAVAFLPSEPMGQIRKTMERAISMRKHFFANEDTNALRLINAEGDALPGLIVDQYADILVVQCTTSGMDRLREWVAETLLKLTGAKAVFEKSTSPARMKEGLESREGWLRGEGSTVITVRERGLTFEVDLSGSQKTGLFIDQREMRTLVRTVAKERTVLDICSYVGGFSVSALAGGALHADAVDYDQQALEQAKKHAAMNNIEPTRMNVFAGDAFDFLRKRPLAHPYDFIILDPPAFAKGSGTDLEPAKKNYIDLNRLAMEMLPAGSLLLTCSCSYQIDMTIFQSVVLAAAQQAKRSVRILQRHRQAFDHPVNIYHPEVDYLKSLLLWVE